MPYPKVAAVAALGLVATCGTLTLGTAAASAQTAAAIAVTSGTGQSTLADQPFADPLTVTVTDDESPPQPVAGAVVTFRVTSGAASFSGGTARAMVDTDSSGEATSPALDGGAVAGPVTVAATTPGVSSPATFGETVTTAIYQAGNNISTSPIPIGSGQNVSYIDEENQWGMAIVAGGVEAWGDNQSGQLGDGTTTPSPTTPVNVTGLSDVVQVDGGNDFALAVLSNHSVDAWGSNAEGDLGNGRSSQYATVPQPIPDLSQVVQVSSGNNHSLALLSNGQVMTWGDNLDGDLGIGSSTPQYYPVLIPSLHNVVAVSAGCDWSLALMSNGAVMAWGLNSEGELGDGTTTNRSVPVKVKHLPAVTQISAGGNFPSNGHALALGAKGEVWAWGDNAEGQLGVPSAGALSATPVRVVGLHNIAAVSAGGSHSLARNTAGDMWVWGSQADGQLGTGGTANVTTPLSSLTDVQLDWAGALGSIFLVG